MPPAHAFCAPSIIINRMVSYLTTDTFCHGHQLSLTNASIPPAGAFRPINYHQRKGVISKLRRIFPAINCHQPERCQCHWPMDILIIHCHPPKGVISMRRCDNQYRSRSVKSLHTWIAQKQLPRSATACEILILQGNDAGSW
jgi:hypothetical protein